MWSNANGTQLDVHLPSLIDPSSGSHVSAILSPFQRSTPDGTTLGWIFTVGGDMLRIIFFLFSFYLDFSVILILSSFLVKLYCVYLLWLNPGFRGTLGVKVQELWSCLVPDPPWRMRSLDSLQAHRRHLFTHQAPHGSPNMCPSAVS